MRDLGSVPLGATLFHWIFLAFWPCPVVCEKPDMMKFTSEIQVSDILNLLAIQILIPETERVDGEFPCEENIILFNKKR